MNLIMREDWQVFDEDDQIVLPWYTMECLRVLSNMDLHGLNVFEYGSGLSTLWYEHRGAHVISIDNNPEWAEKTKAKLITGKQQYLEYIDKFAFGFDVIVIDGEPTEWRDDCIRYALPHLNKDGIIIIDNWDQESCGCKNWDKTKQFIADNNLKIEIYPEPTHVDWKTAIIRK